MKKIIFVLFLISSVVSIGQETEFKITNEVGVNKFVVVEINGQSQQELYAKTMKWFNNNFVTQDSKIEGQIENEMLKIRILENGGMYLFKIDFKDGKYRIEIQESGMYNGVAKVLYPLDTKNLLNKKGEIKFGWGYIERATKELNRYNNSLKTYLENKEESNW